jgi:hypothetical protein
VKTPVLDDDYPGKDEVLLYSKAGLFGVNSWPCTRSQNTILVANEEGPRLTEKQIPELNIETNTTTTDDSDSVSTFSTTSQDRCLNVPHSLFPSYSSSSRENTPERMIANRIQSRTWGSDMKEQSSGDDGDVSSSSVESSQSKRTKKDNSKWITLDGEYDLDKGKSCQLGLITEYLTMDGAAQWSSELSSSIVETFDMKNSDRYKITFKHGGECCTTDKKKPGRKPKVSELSWDLEEEKEISKLIKSYQKKTSGVISEVFGTEIEFDETVLHRISDDSGSIAYENSATRDLQGGELSPTVAIVSLGLSTPRPLFMRTIGNKVTHKISLGSGSLCFTHGKTELRYQRSIPRGFGTEEDQFFLIFIQRTPTREERLTNLKTESPGKETATPPQSATPTNTGTITETHLQAMTPRPDKDLINSTLLDHPEAEDDPQDQSADSIRLKTPPSPPKIKRRLSSIPHVDGVQFKDSLDYEVGDTLILAETISAVVENMSEDVVTAELVRSNTSTAGTVEERRKRLQNKICMSIGELSVSAANNSVNFMKMDSPVDHNVSVLQDDLESIANSQKLIEKAMKHLVDSFVDIEDEIKGLKAERREQAITESSMPKKTKNYDTNQYMINREFAESKEQLDLLNKNIADLQNTLRSITNEISGFRTKTAQILTEAMRDIEKYQASVFSDESQKMIKEIHDYVTYQIPVCLNAATATEEREETDDVEGVEVEEPPRYSDISSEPLPEAGAQNLAPNMTLSPHHPSRQNGQQSPPFIWPWELRLRVNLKQAVLNNQMIDVLLITDSIMRHITEEEACLMKHRIRFNRADMTNTSQLSSTNLLKKITDETPHIIYVHMGINDVHQRSSVRNILENIDGFITNVHQRSPNSKIIISTPLLNGRQDQRSQIVQLRKALKKLVFDIDRTPKLIDRRLHCQLNTQFFSLDPAGSFQQNDKYFGEDRVHLSERGKLAISSCFRDGIHQILREYKLQEELELRALHRRSKITS